VLEIFPLLGLFLSLIVITLNSPYSLILMLLIQSLIIVLWCTLLKRSLWYSYILFLVFLGGLLIIFSYIISLVPVYQPEEFSFKFLYLVFFTSLLRVFWLLTKDFFRVRDALIKVYENIYFIDSLYLTRSTYMYIYVVIYLLITLFCISFIVNKKSGPLRLTK